jgi:type II secretory pathway pseudopilin PulG
VVISLLGVVATLATASYDNFKTQARNDAAQYEMAQIRQALLQFRKDSGSYAFPGQGDYACTASIDYPTGLAVSEQITWCNETTNFWMLFTDPLGQGWNIDTKRGWNGPYLQNKSIPVSQSSASDIPTVISPYDTPYQLINLSNDASAAIVSSGENGTFNPSSECGYDATSDDDNDDIVLCVLR